MGLQELAFSPRPIRPPWQVRRFLRSAERRVRRFQKGGTVGGFVPSDYALSHAALTELVAALAGGRFCEWGSGHGVVACLAAMVGFDAWGIEAEGGLVAASRRLAADFDLEAEFARGSFVPGGAAGLGGGREFAWLDTGGRCGHRALGVAPDEFDVVYAYPWPDEEELVAELFERHGRFGALLLTAHADGGLRLRRKA